MRVRLDGVLTLRNHHCTGNNRTVGPMASEYARALGGRLRAIRSEVGDEVDWWAQLFGPDFTSARLVVKVRNSAAVGRRGLTPNPGRTPAPGRL